MGAETLQEVQVIGERTRSFTSRTVQVGTFRDQDPLDVPLTNNVVTREVLDAQGDRTLFGALRNTAGVTRSQISGSTYDNLSVRGIVVDNFSNYRLNGSLPIINLVEVPLENKERVEVLKGASSLYYGLVPPSGIVNLVTKRAGSTPVTSLATSVNEHGAVDVHADIGRRFGQDEAMGLRLNAAGGKEDIGIDNFKGERGLLALAYDWRLTSRVNLKLDLEHYRKSVSEQAAITMPGSVVPPLPDNTTNFAGDWQRYDAQATNLLARADVSLTDAWLLTLEAGRAETERDRRYSAFVFGPNGLATGAGNLNISFIDNQRWVNTNYRAEVAGRFETGPIAHELTVGATANHRDSYSGDTPAAGQTSATVAQNYFNPVDIARINRAFTQRGVDSDRDDKGAYVFDRLLLGEQWQFMAGLRYVDYKATSPTSRNTAEDVSPNASLMYKPTPDISLYATYLQGLEETGNASQTVGGRPVSNVGDPLPPSVNHQREFGVKARVAGNAFVQAAYFDIDRSLATYVPDPADPARLRFVLGGETEYRGLELSASGEIGRQWALVASAILLDAEITKVGATNPADLGKTPENTPKRTFSLFAEYRVPQVPGWSVNAGAFYVGERPVNNANTAFVGSYTTYSLGTRYATRMGGMPVMLQANVDNLADRDYWSTAGAGLLGVGMPRTLRVAAKVDF